MFVSIWCIAKKLLQRKSFIGLLAGLMIAGMVLPVAAQEGTALERIKKSGVLKVALYNNYPPFSFSGQGIDFDIANALAAKLGVKMSPLWFDADENMEDDLRNMVWKGHYLGYGPADVLMHAPIDREYMSKVERVKFFAAYHRERYAVGRLLDKMPVCETFDMLESIPFAVEGDTLASTVMLSLDSGKYRNSLKVFRTGGEAVQALSSGAVALSIAQQSELEWGLKGNQRFAVDLPPNPVLQKRQWVVGLAVKSQGEDLALALQNGMNELMADGSINQIMQKYGVTHRKP